MSVKRRIAFFLIPLALLALCVVQCLFSSVTIQTSLDELIGLSGHQVPKAIRTHSAGLVPILVSSTDADAARTTAEHLFSALQREQPTGEPLTNFCHQIKFRFDGATFEEALTFYRRARSGLASETARTLLATAEGRATLARKAVRKYVASPVPPLFPPAEDPFCLLDGFVTSLPTSFAGWFPKNGVLSAERDGITHVLMVLDLKRSVVDDVDQVIRFNHGLTAAIQSVAAPPSVTIAVCGAPIHTALSASACQREIGWLTLFSVVFIVLLSVIVFRSVRWIPCVVVSLIVSVLAGGSALLALFGGFHLMTVVMGTTVLGLVIDYSFHWLLQGACHQRETQRNLLLSCLTTEISLLPLMLSTIPVLRQSAVFLGVALAAALTFVLTCYPRPSDAVATKTPSAPHVVLRPILVLLALVALGGLFFLRFGTDLLSVYRPPAQIAATEKLFAQLSGTTDPSRGFIVTTGDSLESCLARELALNLPENLPRLSRFLPPLAIRHHVAENVAKLYAEHGEFVKRALALSSLSLPDAPRAWQVSEVPDVARSFLAEDAVMIPSAPPPEKVREGVVFCQPRTLVVDILSGWAVETGQRLVVALGLMFLVLAVFCRARAFTLFMPSFFALVVVGGLLGWMGESVNLFHLLAGFLLAGMSVDYTLFLHSGKSVKPVACSLLTSLAGFGALIFVSFPVVRSFGLVLGIGLPVAFAAGWASVPRRKSVEQGASPLGLECLWLFYRLFGLTVLHVTAAGVGLCVWTFSSSVRRASPSVRKMIYFTRSLADKLVVMAEGKSLPRVETDGTADAAQFIADVADGKGVFILSSHCGTVETLVALGACTPTFHAWMDIDRTSVFNRFYLRHARRARVVIHPISEIGMETAFMAGEALDRGDCLVMAGDRGRGAFRFAKALEHPVYFAACVWTNGGYRAIIRRLPSARAEMEQRYREILTETIAAFPDQHFTWET